MDENLLFEFERRYSECARFLESDWRLVSAVEEVMDENKKCDENHKTQRNKNTNNDHETVPEALKT